MQGLNASSLCEQSESLKLAVRDLRNATCNLAQTHATWNPDVNDYLREETYMDAEARDFIESLVEVLETVNPALVQLTRDHQTLCHDLMRVGRGESFSS